MDGVSTVVSTVTCFPRDDRPGAIDRIDRAGNINLIDAAERADVARFVFVSFKPIPLDFPLQRAKRAVEERLRQAALEAVVLRPGKLMDVWFSPLCGFDVSSARATVFGDGTSPVTWIAAADVAEIAARSALGDGPAQGEVELGGPEALSQQQVIDALRRRDGAVVVGAADFGAPPRAPARRWAQRGGGIARGADARGAPGSRDTHAGRASRLSAHPHDCQRVRDASGLRSLTRLRGWEPVNAAPGVSVGPARILLGARANPSVGPTSGSSRRSAESVSAPWCQPAPPRPMRRRRGRVRLAPAGRRSAPRGANPRARFRQGR